jgi:hypothetical protein
VRTKHPLISFELFGNISVSLNLGKDNYRYNVPGYSPVAQKGKGKELYRLYSSSHGELGPDELYDLSVACGHGDERVPFLLLGKICGKTVGKTSGKTAISEADFVDFCDENAYCSFAFTFLPFGLPYLFLLLQESAVKET